MSNIIGEGADARAPTISTKFRIDTFSLLCLLAFFGDGVRRDRVNTLMKQKNRPMGYNSGVGDSRGGGVGYIGKLFIHNRCDSSKHTDSCIL